MTVTVWKLNCRPQPNARGGVDLQPVSLAQEARSLDAASAQLPAGAYTTFRTYLHSKALRLADHYQRLEQTAALAGKPMMLDRLCLSAALRALISAAPAMDDQRFRLTVDLEHDLGQVYIAAEPLKVPSATEYAQGALAITCDVQRILPEAKLTRFIERAGEVRRNLPPGVNEAIMVDSGSCLREGLSSNFFAVRDGVLWTASEGVLAGITRATVLDCAGRLGLPVELRAVRLADLTMLDEAFITSASRGVLPLRCIDETSLRSPAPGPFTRQIMLAFDQAITSEIEPI